MPNSKFLTSEFMVLDAKNKDNRSRGPGAGPGLGARRGDPAQETMQQQRQGDMTRPAGPGMAYGRWSEELQRQRIMSASRSAFLCCAKRGGSRGKVHLMWGEVAARLCIHSMQVCTMKLHGQTDKKV